MQRTWPLAALSIFAVLCVDTTSVHAARTNPFNASAGYINANYTEHAETSAAQQAPTSALSRHMKLVGHQPTAIWLDRVGAIYGGAKNDGRLSLAQHLDAAVQQSAAAGVPATVLLVLYNLPERDCAAPVSNGELHGASGAIAYRTKYIDAVARVLRSKPEYASLRLVVVVEPEALPSLVHARASAQCRKLAAQGVYTAGIAYAVQTLGAMENATLYLDIGNAAQWRTPGDLDAAVQLLRDLLNQPGVRGLATNTASYIPLRATDDAAVDALSFVQTLTEVFAGAGFADLGFIVDTSRNGWPHGHPPRSHGCNVQGAGIGERPRGNPITHTAIDAFAWIKPPGESDGLSADNASDTPGSRFNPNCDANNPQLNAMANAPMAGAWFDAAFVQLSQNATPAFDDTPPPTPPAPAPPTPRAPLPAPSPHARAPCSAWIQMGTAWPNHGTYEAVMLVHLTNLGDTAVPPPWSLELHSAAYLGVQQAWGWDVQSVAPGGHLAGLATSPWQTLRPHQHNQVTVGLTVEASQADMRPEGVAVNGTPCSLTVQ